MDFELSDEQAALVEATRRTLADNSPLAEVRRRAEAEEGSSPGLWRQGAELGWAGLAVPEEFDGFGQGVADWALIAIELGRSLAPTPFLQSVVVLDALCAAGNPLPEATAAILEGRTAAGWAIAEPGSAFGIQGINATAKPAGDGSYVLSGSKSQVIDGTSVGHLLVDVMLDGEPARFLVPAGTPGLSLATSRQIDITREIVDITFTDSPVTAQSLVCAGKGAAAGIERSTWLAAVLASAELVGVGEAMLADTVEYAKIRTQFNAPIGSFQAVKHMCAEMRKHVQATRAATLFAAMAIDGERADAARAASVAKAYASDAIPIVAGNALQTHGGIGFTWEHDLHLFIRRAQSDALLFGDTVHHRELLCASLELTGAGLSR